MNTETENKENKSTEGESNKEERSRIINALIFLGGTICLILGIIGIVLPILPTTPFLLVAAAAYAKSSKRFYKWLTNNRVLGSYITNYREGRGMPVKTKAITLSLFWITLLLTMFVFVPILWVQILLLIIGIAVSTHIIRIKPKNVKSDIKETNS